MRFQVLGAVAIRRDGREERLSGRLERTLLALLLARSGRPVPWETLAEALWGEGSDARGRQRLQLQVHRLRRRIGEDDRLAWEPAGYRLRLAAGELDAERFEALVGEGLAAADEDPERAVGALRAALALWRGAPFAGLDLPALDGWAHRLAARRVDALEALYAAELALGRHTAAAAELAPVVRAHPLRERLHVLLMTALWRAGRPAEALAAYRAAREALAGELGLEPGPELRELERAVLAGARPTPEPAAPAGPPPVVPAQLPLNVRDFVGREGELARLDALLARSPGAVATVTGTAGVGKTALAVRWAHRSRARFPDGQLYVDLRGYGPGQPVAAQDALAGFLRALGPEGAVAPGGIAERAARFRSLVAGRRMLIVLDNAHAAEQVRPLLPGGSTCLTVVTSRDALEGLGAEGGAGEAAGQVVERVRLERLPAADAGRLLRELLGERVADEPAATGALVDRCARLPLALRVAAELIRSRPALTVAELTEELGREQGALDLLDLDGDPHTAMRPVFSWSYRRLDPATARVFRLLGPHPGPDLDAEGVAALAGLPPSRARACLAALRRAHLVDETGEGRYRLHDLLREYAAERAAATEPAAERAAALGRLRRHLLHGAATAMDVFAPHDYAPRPKAPPPPGPPVTFADHDAALRWLHAERANLLALTRDAEPAFAIAASETLHLYLRVGGYFDEALALHGRALDAATAAGDRLAEANARRALGTTMNLAGGDLTRVTDHFQQALAAYRAAGEPALAALVLGGLGGVSLRRGDLTGALGQFEEALDGARANWRAHCAVLVNLGRTLRTLGRLDEARAHLERVLELRAPHGDRAVEANTHCVLADVRTRLGHEEAAFTHARRGLALARASGYRQIEAHCLVKLGTLHRLRGETERAFALHGRALAIARAVGEPELTVETLNALGRGHTGAGAPERALPLHREALALAGEAGERIALAHSHAAAAAAHAGVGDRPAARAHWREALTGYAAAGLPEAAEARERLAALDGPAPDGD
ncbi:tetratricopeptide repeat protein [Streptomyces sp. 3MP-14]|uniref:Tetratricopeptide repeat protein n=1 Tax=Streptomyces mimosae TaxID=2586635 RepID=A0A5N6AGG1_9ACTN|nr:MULTISPECIES: BTAD domain-containing putative transcriptional regulator [Streptomyces]KAB8167153.1 tetratricopeptide repeat protein [Streptomyces mimosae]KAB8177094.1 tetratricopeptide repeat protein [Streptomyces sp. 3MP-14]